MSLKKMENNISAAARKLAKELHHGQTDKAGKDYFSEHLCHVAGMGDDWMEVVVGYLHDAAEDTQYDVPQIMQMLQDRCSEHLCNDDAKTIQEALNLLNSKTASSREEYIARFCQSNNKLAASVKLNDLKHNIISRIENPTEKDCERVERYKREFSQIKNIQMQQMFDEQYHQWYDKFEKEDGLKEGAKVRYIGINDKNDACIKYSQYCGHPSDPRGILEPDAIYEVEYRILARSYQLVKLVGFQYGVEFSPSIFEVIDKSAESKPLKVGGRVRYIGLEDEVLVSGNTYEVEGLLLHHYGCGFVSVKLVGIENIYERSMFERVEVTTNKI